MAVFYSLTAKRWLTMMGTMEQRNAPAGASWKKDSIVSGYNISIVVEAMN
jgi:hypothetical protein